MNFAVSAVFGIVMGSTQENQLRRYIDMWAVPGVHPTNSEYLQSFKMAESDHFTRHMQAVGTVSEKDAKSGWQKTHLIGLRTDVWQPDARDIAETLKNIHDKRRSELKKAIKKSGRLSAQQFSKLQEQLEKDTIMQMQTDDILNRRLVLKLFRNTGKRLNWCGTLEQVTITEIQHSIGSQRTLLSLAAILPRYEYVVRLQQNHRSFRLGDVFTLSYHYQSRMSPICVQRRWGSLGADYDILAEGQRIGMINGVVFGLGSDSYLNLSHPDLNRSCRLADLLTLFAASVGYHRSMRRSAKQRIKACQSGDWHKCVVEDEELGIFKNGRAA